MATLTELNQLPAADFIHLCEPLLEHCEWALNDLAAQRPFQSKTEMENILAELLYQADEDKQLAALRQHPKLGVGKAQAGFSQQEQQKAGLKHLTEEELEQFEQLNDAYEKKFDFPFVIAVAGLNKQQILEAMEQRLNSDAESEFTLAMAALVKIAQLRIHKLLSA